MPSETLTRPQRYGAAATYTPPNAPPEPAPTELGLTELGLTEPALEDAIGHVSDP